MFVCIHPEQMTFAIQHLGLAKFENGTVLGEPNVMTADERFKLVERYEQDQLEDDADPPFKRILFWNDVHINYTIVPINISDIIKCQ
jgi:hypothetical protein